MPYVMNLTILYKFNDFRYRYSFSFFCKFLCLGFNELPQTKSNKEMIRVLFSFVNYLWVSKVYEFANVAFFIIERNYIN